MAKALSKDGDGSRKNAVKREAARALARGARSGPAASPPALGASDGPEAIGRRIEVFWPEDDTWYGGRVAELYACRGIPSLAIRAVAL